VIKTFSSTQQSPVFVVFQILIEGKEKEVVVLLWQHFTMILKKGGKKENVYRLTAQTFTPARLRLSGN